MNFPTSSSAPSTGGPDSPVARLPDDRPAARLTELKDRKRAGNGDGYSENVECVIDRARLPRGIPEPVLVRRELDAE